MKYIYFILLSLACSSGLLAQADKPLVQFSGVVLGSDTRRYASFVSIVSPTTRKGTVSDYQGYFSFVASPNDTFVFSAIGYKKQLIVIPGDISQTAFSKNIILDRDTLELPLVNIYPWPDYETFKRDFLTRIIPDDDLTTAQKNLNRQTILALGKYQPMDGIQNSNRYFQQQVQQLYYRGQFAPNQLLNPLAWAQFFQMLKEGRISLKSE